MEHPIPYAHTVDVTARPSLNVRKAPTTAAAKIGSLANGRNAVTTRLEKYGGRYSVNGAVRTDWLEVRAGTRTGWVARGYTRLVR
ncbi:MAG: SH3 domain-containing protein [Candidatus Limnocylindrales bacterium]